jgi:5-methylcytosine-specific restriction endonuclease McrA
MTKRQIRKLRQEREQKKQQQFLSNQDLTSAIQYYAKKKTLTLDEANLLALATQLVRDRSAVVWSARSVQDNIISRKKHSFYDTAEWKQLRYSALAASDGRCQCCGASAAEGAQLRVDHIQPISQAPHRKADPTNLQVLCNDCNWGKGGWDQTDWRYSLPSRKVFR